MAINWKDAKKQLRGVGNPSFINKLGKSDFVNKGRKGDLKKRVDKITDPEFRRQKNQCVGRPLSSIPRVQESYGCVIV